MAHVEDNQDGWLIQRGMITIDNEIDRGGQGSVYRGKFNGRDVAVKTTDEKEMTAIHYLRGLEHRNLLQIMGICKEERWVVMELCPNGTLFSRLQKRRLNDTPPEMLDWSRQLAEGMVYLHQRNIIHRDLKSPNILFGLEDVVKISDFGFVRECVRSENMTQLGTLRWMAPELIKAEKYDSKVDIWSFGVLVWEMLTCDIPFRDLFEQKIRIAAYKGEELRPTIPDHCSEPIRQLLNRCWAQDYHQRPPFTEIIEVLQNIEQN